MVAFFTRTYSGCSGGALNPKAPSGYVTSIGSNFIFFFFFFAFLIYGAILLAVNLNLLPSSNLPYPSS